jgi:hypothetical protein
MANAQNIHVSDATDDSITLLRKEHRQIEQCFLRHRQEHSEDRWNGVLKETLLTLKVHIEIEEDILYPAFLEATNKVEMHHDAMVENELIKKLISDLEHSDPGDDYYESMIRILWKKVNDRITEEEAPEGMFEIAGRLSMNSPALRERLLNRRGELIELMQLMRRI